MILNTIFLLFTIVFLETIFSMDNALVLAELASKLPKNKPLKLPKLLKPFEKYFLSQRQSALKIGLLGAYFGRALMLLFAEFIIKHTFIKVLGALYLLHLAFKNLGELAIGSETFEQEIEHDFLRVEQKLLKKVNKGFWGTVLMIELSDLAFSLDNVVAIVVLSSNFLIIFFGVALGILIIRFMANKLIKFIEKYPALGTSAYILILNIAIELFLSILFHIHISDIIKFLVSITTVLMALIYDIYLSKNARAQINIILKGVGKVLYFIDYYATLRFIWGKEVEVEK